jgi:prepilin-type N-terminal cleavage/methylation domain-containing protein
VDILKKPPLRNRALAHVPVSRAASLEQSSPAKRGARAFTFVEVLVAMVIVSVLFMAIYGAVANSLSITKLCQENERVTQMLSDKLDVIRLYSIDQLTNGFMPTTFIERMDAADTNTPYYYTGIISSVQAPISEKYKTNLMQVTVQVKWLSGKRPQNRSMTTYVARYGLQTYIAP